MSRRFKRALWVLWALFLPVASHAAELPACTNIARETVLETTSATAGLFANLREADGSLKKESKRLIASAIRKAAVPPADLCPPNCAPAPEPLVVIRTLPSQFTADNEERGRCDELYRRTSDSPLRYQHGAFSSVDDVVSWFTDFSQGWGKDGRHLYQHCNGVCSPQYTSLIEPQGDNLLLTALVVCGQPRDREQDLYNVSVGLRWVCQNR